MSVSTLQSTSAKCKSTSFAKQEKEILFNRINTKFFLGVSVPKQYAHLTRPLPGDISIPGNSSFDDDRTTTMSD